MAASFVAFFPGGELAAEPTPDEFRGAADHEDDRGSARLATSSDSPLAGAREAACPRLGAGGGAARPAASEPEGAALSRFAAVRGGARCIVHRRRRAGANRSPRGARA